MKMLMNRAAMLGAAMASAIFASPAAAQASPSPYTSATRYDVEGRVTGTIAPDPDGIGAGALKFPAVRNTYDAAGRLVRVETGELANWKSEAIAPSAWGADFTVHKYVDTFYDALDRKVKEQVASGVVPYALTQYSYDSAGRLECTAVRMNSAAWSSLPASACTLGTEGTVGPDRITRNVYNAAGELIQVREGVGTSVEAAEATYSYTLNGKKEYVIDANGNRARFVYDGHDRLSQWQFPSTTRPGAYNDASQSTALSTAGAVNTADYEQYGYDANDNRTSLRKRDGSVLTYGYDALNRMTVKVVPERAGLAASATRDVYYDYDLRGLMLKSRFDSLSGEGVTHLYNGFGELLWTNVSQSGLTLWLNYTFDREGKRTSVRHPDNATFTYARDGLGRVSTVYEGTTLTAAGQLIQASYNDRGLVASVQRAQPSQAFLTGFGWDAIGRLQSMINDAAGTSWDSTLTQWFNPASQIRSQTRSNDAYAWTGAVAVNRPYTTNGLNQYIAAGSASFTYDANGNLTSDGSSSFVYDVENRLVSASGARSSTLSYDPMGRLWRVTGPTSDAMFLYDGDELVAEYDAAGTLSRRYVHSDNADDPVVQYVGPAVGSGNRQFLMPDERGSIVALVANDGTASAINSYDEYGIPRTTVGGTSANGVTGRFAYTGQIWLPELGMYHYKARIYSPTLGRFLQVDPIGYEDQVNLYAYVGDDPVNKSDPTGTKCVESTGECTADTLNGKSDFKGNEGYAGSRDQAKVQSTETAATHAYKTLKADPKKPVTVTHKWKPTGSRIARTESKTLNLTYGDLAKVLETTNINVDTVHHPEQTRALSGPGNPITVYDRATLGSPGDLQRTFYHEPIHYYDSDFRADPNFSDSHKREFNNAVDPICRVGPYQCN